MADKKKKQQRLKARQPRGFQDRMAADIRATDAMMAKIREVFERYGFDPIETPMFEYTDALGKFLPDTDRPNEGVFSLTDDDDQWMSLRYDMTAPLARHVAQNINEIQMPYRTYRAGYVFRNEKPGPGRFRQFMQFDADSVGASGPAADAEMCMMMADTMEALGLKKGEYAVRVNDRRLLDGVMEAIGLGGNENAEKRLGVLRAIDKLDRLGASGVRALLGKEGRTDESGDHTDGMGLSPKAVQAVISLIAGSQIDRKAAAYDRLSKGEIEELGGEPPTDDHGKNVRADETFSALFNENSPFRMNDTFELGWNSLRSTLSVVADAGFGFTQIRIDPSCVRGLEYYTGTVFECEILADIPNEKGEIVQFGSVAGGGRYDGLVKRFTGQDVPATGFSIGVSRLATALKNLGKLETETLQGPIVVTVMDKDSEALAGYQKLVQMLRESENDQGVKDLRAEMYQGNPKNFGKQLQYADRRGSPVAIIQGSAERERRLTVQIKDLVEGARLSADITDHTEWRGEEGVRPAQQTVKVADMVATVRKILAR